MHQPSDIHTYGRTGREFVCLEGWRVFVERMTFDLLLESKQDDSVA